MNAPQVSNSIRPAQMPKVVRRPAAEARPAAASARRPVKPAAKPQQAAFSFKRAMGHFWAGMKAQGRDMIQALTAKPLATLAFMAVSTVVMLGAPMLGISAVALGNLLLFTFTGLALFRMGGGALEAFQAHRRGDGAGAEAAFERIGRGGFDLALTVGPAALGKAVSILRRTEAGRAVAAAFAETAAGKALASVTGAIKAPFEAAGRGLERLGRGLPSTPTGGIRHAIAKSAPVRAFNHVFDTLPTRAVQAFEGWAITKINYSKTGMRIRDWGVHKLAEIKPTAIDPKALAASRELKHPPGEGVLERFGKVSDGVYRGAAPRTEAEFRFLVEEQNVKTIVNLMHPGNPKEIALIEFERQMAAKYGVEFINLPLPFGVEPPQHMVKTWLDAVQRSQASAGKSNIYVHCRLGRDRTGTMVAVHRMANEGKTGAQALGEMRSFGFNPEHDTYLQYLADFVLEFGDRTAGVVKAGLDVAESALGLKSTLPAAAASARKRLRRLG